MPDAGQEPEPGPDGLAEVPLPTDLLGCRSSGSLIVAVVYHVTTVAIGHWLLKKLLPFW